MRPAEARAREPVVEPAVEPAEPPAAAAPAARRRPDSILPVLLLVALLLGGAGFVAFGPLADLSHAAGRDRLAAWLAQQAFGAGWTYLLLTAAAVALGAPRLLFAAAGGAFFGWELGGALALAGTLLGCLVAYCGARRLGRGWVHARLGPRLRIVQALVAGNGGQATLVLRLLPVGNCQLTNVLLALAGVRPLAFVCASGLGMLPSTLVTALYGQGAAEGSLRLIVSASALLVVLVLCVPWLLRAHPAGRRLMAARAERSMGGPGGA